MPADQTHVAMARTALYYDDDAYQESSHRRNSRAGQARGLMGRQVAGKEFLNAYLAHGTWSELVAVVPHVRCRESLHAVCASHPSSRHRPRRLKIVEVKRFQSTFAAAPPADVLHFPAPPDVRFAWARENLGPVFALSGVTHTLCSATAVEALRQMLTAPFESFDRLICTSRAVMDTARAITETFAEYLQQRWGGEPKLRIQFELLPLGVDVEKYVPATPAERTNERNRWQIAEDEFVVLFMGRLSHHAKAHPFPMFRALAEAARRTRRRLRLILAGWSPLPAILDAFRDGAQRFAPNVTTTILDGNRPDIRYSVWKGADLFSSLSDNIQETFGLVLVEAMASGLPIVASDWDGYRDVVVDGETGFLVPTFMVRDATRQLTAQLLMGEINYDHFLARSNQCVSVDVAAATEAYVRLIQDDELRRRMGAAGRERACQRFAWSHVIRAYESLWRQQATELADHRLREALSTKSWPGPSAYPAPERSFAGYPSRWLGERDVLYTSPEAEQRVEILAATPLTNYEASQRCVDVPFLKLLLSAAANGRTVQELDVELQQRGNSHPQCRATLAWLLKYDLLRVGGE